MARQEHDSVGPTARDSTSGPASIPTASNSGNSQFAGASPQAMRPGASPNLTDKVKRGTPQMNNANVPSPLPESVASRGSPNALSFNTMGGQMDSVTQQQQPQFNIIHAANGMRPTASHPSQPFSGAMPPPHQQRQQLQPHQAPQQSPQVQHQGQPPSSSGPSTTHAQWLQGQCQGVDGPGGTPNIPHQVPMIQGTPQQRSMVPPLPAVPGSTTTSPALAARPPTPKTKRKDGDSKTSKNSKVRLLLPLQ